MLINAFPIALAPSEQILLLDISVKLSIPSTVNLSFLVNAALIAAAPDAPILLLDISID